MYRNLERMVLEKALIVSDTHNCSEDSLWLLRKLAIENECNMIWHAGDMIDAHLGHRAFEGLEIYICLVPGEEKNRYETEPEKYNLPTNWHLLSETKGNNVVHFKYFSTSPFVLPEDREREFCVCISHNLGLDCLRTKVSELQEEDKHAYVWQIVSELNRRYKTEHTWINLTLVGHSHHVFVHCAEGMKLVNPGEWERKMCFGIVQPGPLDIHLMSLTENLIRVR